MEAVTRGPHRAGSEASRRRATASSSRPRDVSAVPMGTQPAQRKSNALPRRIRASHATRNCRTSWRLCKPGGRSGSTSPRSRRRETRRPGFEPPPGGAHAEHRDTESGGFSIPRNLPAARGSRRERPDRGSAAVRIHEPRVPGAPSSRHPRRHICRAASADTSSASGWLGLVLPISANGR